MHIKQTGTILARQEAALPAMQELVSFLCTASTQELTASANRYQNWSRPRIDLYVLTPVLNVFDDVLTGIVAKYKLESQFSLIEEKDEQLVEAILSLSVTFIEHGSNRGVYSSLTQVFALLRTANNKIIIGALKLISKLLALRYRGIPTANWPVALKALPLDLIATMSRAQTTKVEYMYKESVKTFCVDPAQPIDQQFEQVPSNVPQTAQCVTALRAINTDEFLISQLYACSVCTLSDHTLATGSLESITIASNSGARTVKLACYDAVRDMCFIQGEDVVIYPLRRLLTATCGNMRLMVHLSQIIQGMSADKLDIELATSFFRMVSQIHLIISITTAPLPLLIEFSRVPVDPKYMPVQTNAMITLYLLLMDEGAYLTPFLELGGLGIIVQTLHTELQPERLMIQNEDEITLVPIDYSLSYTKLQWIKSLLVIVANVVRHKSSPAIITQLLNTPILDVLVSIISQPKLFGWLVVTMCIRTLAILVKMESSTVSMLVDNPVGVRILTTVESDSVFYYPSLFQLAGALFSNEQGAELVKSRYLIPKLFKNLAKADFSVYSCLRPIGRAIVEISTSDPSYLGELTYQIIKFIEQVSANLEQGNPLVGVDGTKLIEPPKSSVQVLNVVFMMLIASENHLFTRMFLEKRGLDAFLDLCCSPSLPFDMVTLKEMFLHSYSFSSFLKKMYALDTDTEYILDTFLDRIDNAAVKVISSFSSGTPQSIDMVGLKQLNMLVHAFSLLISGSASYRISLAIKAIALRRQSRTLFANLGEIFKHVIRDLGSLVKTMPENVIVATWPAAVFECFNKNLYDPKHLTIIEKARESPKYDEGTYMLQNATRNILTISQYSLLNLFSTLAFYSSTEQVIVRGESEALQVAQYMAQLIITVLTSPERCDFPLYYYGQVGHFCDDVLSHSERLNIAVLIYFKQMNGLGAIFDVHRKIITGPEPETFRLYLMPATPTKHLAMHAQQRYFHIYRLMALESEIPKRLHILNGLEVYFSVQQFMIEIRIQLVYMLGTMLAPLMPEVQPRTLMLFCDLIKMVVRPVKTTVADGEPKRLLSLPVRTKAENEQALLKVGVDLQDAKTELRQAGENLRIAIVALRQKYTRYKNLADIDTFSEPLSEKLVEWRGQSIHNFKAFDAFKEEFLLEAVVPSLLKITSPDRLYYTGCAISQIKGVLRLVKPLLNQNIGLVAAMIKDPQLLEDAFEVLCESEILVSNTLNLDPYAVFITEQLVAKEFWQGIESGNPSSETDLFFYDRNIPLEALSWHKAAFKEFIDAAARECAPGLQSTSVARLVLLLSGRDYDLGQAVLRSKLVYKLFSAARELKGNAYGKRVEACLLLLGPILLEEPNSLENYILHQLCNAANDNLFVENIADQVSKWSGFLARCPRLFVSILRQIAFPVDQGVVSLVWTSTLQKFVKKLIGSLEHQVPDFDQLMEAHQVEIPQPLSAAQIGPLNGDQVEFVNYLLKELMDLPYKSQCWAIAKSKREENDKLVKVQASALLADAHHITFLLTALANMLQANQNMFFTLANYPNAANGLKMPKYSAFIHFVLTNFIGYENPALEICNTVSSCAMKMLRCLLVVPKDALYTQESSQLHTHKCKFLLDNIAKLLVAEFISLKPTKFLEKLDWRIVLLEKTLHLLNDLMEKLDTRLDKFSKVPIVPACILEKKLVSIVSMCVAKLNIRDPALSNINSAYETFVHLVGEFENLDFEAAGSASSDEEDSGSEGSLTSDLQLEFELGSDEEGLFSISGSDIDVDYLYGDDFDDSAARIEPEQPSIFRHSTLGMYEQETDNEASGREEDDLLVNSDQEYDRLSDDEVLSDMDQMMDEEDDEDEMEEEDMYYSDELEDYDDEIAIADAELDISDFSDDGGEYHANGDLNQTFGDPLEIVTDVSFSDSNGESDHSDIDSAQGLSLLDVPLRRLSDNMGRPAWGLNLAESRAVTWLISPIWICPQQIEAEQVRALGAVYNPEQEVDCDSLYIPRRDLPDFDFLLSTWFDLLPKLGYNEPLFYHYHLTYSYPWIFSTQAVVEQLGEAAATEQSVKVIQQVQWLADKKDSEDDREEDDSDDSAEDEEQHFSDHTSDESSDEDEDDVENVINFRALGIDPLFYAALPESIQQELLEYHAARAAAQGENEPERFPLTLPLPVLQLTDESGPAALLKQIIEVVGHRTKSSPWLSCKTKRATGHTEWATSIEPCTINSILRLLYGISLSQTSFFNTLMSDLCNNYALARQILSTLTQMLHDLCNGRAEQSYEFITQKALISDICKSRPVYYPFDINEQQRIAFVAKCLDQVCHSLFCATDSQPELNPQHAQILFGEISTLVDKPLVVSNSQGLEWITSIVAGLCKCIASKHEHHPWEREAFTEPPETSPVASPSADTTLKEPCISVGATTSSGPDSIINENVCKFVNILQYDECSAETFERVLEGIANLSLIPEIYDRIKACILKSGRKYRQKVLYDLKSFIVKDENDSIQLEPSFTGSNSSQTKLLRLVTFMDYLHDTKQVTSKEERRYRYSELMSMFKAVNLYPVWEKLGACLDVIERQDFKLSAAFLPLIECITVVSKRVLNSEKENSYSGWLKKYFIDFTLRHRKILNYLVRLNPKLLSGSFAILSKDSRIMDFDNKLNYFNRRAAEEKKHLGSIPVHVKISRDKVVPDTFRALYHKTAEEFKSSKLQIAIQGEEAVDAGGVTREWYELLSSHIFNPQNGLFKPIFEGSTIYHPNPAWTGKNGENSSLGRKAFFQFIGRLIGKAVYDGRIISCYFSTAFYKRMLKKPVDLNDMETFDPDYYKSLKWMLDNDITNILTETFSVEEETTGKVVELVPNGENIAVTEQNKIDYVKRIVQFKLIDSVEQQLDALAQGFEEMIPDKLRPVFYELFDERELELLICGLPQIDLDDWRANTTYLNYNLHSPQVKWFWRAVSSFNDEERAKLLQFCTGTSKVPVGGFAKLETSNNAPKFTIARDFGAPDRWPSAHTCTNQIDLPLYASYDQLRSALAKAITEGSSGFGFA